MIFIATDFRAIIFNDEVYLAPKAYTIFKRYSDNLGPVILCCRYEITLSDNLPANYAKANFVKKIIRIDGYKNLLLNKYDNIITSALIDADLIIVRVPSIVGFHVAKIAKRMKKSILSEAMGDAWDSYWNHGFIGKIVAPYMHQQMKSVMSYSQYAIYVTNSYLQKRYPTKNTSINASNVNILIPEKKILDGRLRKINGFNKYRFSIATLGGANVVAKGHKYVIQAISTLKRDYSIIIDYYIVGGGDNSRLYKIAQSLGVTDQVHFTGELSMNDVFILLDKIDIYIQPSLQEGLPRSVIEAMSRACPVIGSNTAGTPELLDSTCIFKRGSSKTIVEKLLWFIEQDLSKYAIRNFKESGEYTDEKISIRRNEYFNYIKTNNRQH